MTMQSVGRFLEYPCRLLVRVPSRDNFCRLFRHPSPSRSVSTCAMFEGIEPDPLALAVSGLVWFPTRS